MKIRAVEAYPFRLPPRRAFKWAGLNVDLGGFVLVRIETDDGLVGYGEATPLPDWGGDWGRHSGETLATVAHMVNAVFAPALIGRDPTAVTAARLLLDRLVIGNVYAKCAVDIALHDLWGKATGLPIYKLLGGAVRDTVPVAHMIGLMDEGDALREGVAAAADGVRSLQIKGGVDLDRDVRLTAALRHELGAGITLRLDANQGYGHAKTAVADSRWARIGSTNLNLNSWMGNWELDVAIEDADVARTLESHYEQDLARSTEVVLREGRRDRRRPLQPPSLRYRSSRRMVRTVTGVGRSLGAAVTGNRALENFELRPIVTVAALLAAFGAVGAFVPWLLAWPVSAILLWLAFSLLAEAWQVWRRSSR